MYVVIWICMQSEYDLEYLTSMYTSKNLFISTDLI